MRISKLLDKTKKCPFGHVESIAIESKPSDLGEYRVVCYGPDMTRECWYGPRRAKAEDAVKAWNKRA